MSLIKERFFHQQENREWKIIQSLPPVFFRLFGDIDYQEQLRDIPAIFKGKLVILTTCDTPDKEIIRLRAENWIVVKSNTVSEEQARTNSSLLLNEGLRFAIDHSQSYAFFLSSGFQRQLDMFYGAFYKASERHPNQDAYYFVLPETHSNLSLGSYEAMRTDNVDEFLLKGFPSETALFMRTTLPLFETKLSPKGNLGFTEDGGPLGGMEFLLTLFDAYTRAKKDRETFLPCMLGLTLPMPSRSGTLAREFYRQSHEVPASGLSQFDLPSSLEVTPHATKLARRVPTWRAAMKRLELTDDDIQNLFSQTKFELGFVGTQRFVPQSK